jgi:membrane protease YdiL (CAAX protease family)
MEILGTLFIFLIFLLPVIAANFSERHRREPYVLDDPQRDALLDAVLRYLPTGLLISINLGLLAIALLALLNQAAKAVAPHLLDAQTLAANWWGVAAACSLTGLLGFLPLVPALRRWLARWLPIDPASYVHTAALAFTVYQIGLSIGQMALIGDLETLTAPGLALTIWDLIVTALPLVLFALVGVGLFIRRDGKSTLARLGLRWPTWRQLLVAAVLTGLLLALDYGVNLMWEQVDPAGYELLERVMENLFGGLLTVGGAIALGLTAGISEELLFRGAVQPRLGLLLASVLFAIGHLQYGLTMATLEIFVIGLVLGLVRNRTHTTICILIHASYNTISTLMGMYLP